MNSLPRLKLAHLPTPVEAMPRLSTALGGPQLLIKRDDLTGLAFGGNKTRKLEFLFAEAQANGARTVLTAGAKQSNHCRQTAAAAARLGFECKLVLTLQSGRSEAPSSEDAPTGNLLLDHLFGADIIWAQPEARDEVLKASFQESWDSGERPYLIPYGGSNTTGAVAYAFALQELLDQNIDPDWIVFPSSSGGTQAGLVLGSRLFGFSGQVLGISVDEPIDVLQERVARLATETADILGEKYSFKAQDIQVNADYLGGGYGVIGKPEKESIAAFASQEGLLLDPVYTGRAAAGLIDLIHKGFFSNDQSILFWHTGGTPALFAEQYMDILRTYP